LALWAFAVASSLLGFRKVLLWMGVLVVYCTAFVAFESQPLAAISFALSILAIAALRTTVGPKLLAILGTIAGAVLWPVLFFAGVHQHASAAELISGVLFGAVLGVGLVAAAEVAWRTVDWGDRHLPRGGSRAERAQPRLQFSLTQMFMVVVLLALLLSWTAWELREERRNREAVEWLESRGASVACHRRNWLESLLNVKPITNVWVSRSQDVNGEELTVVLTYVAGLPYVHDLSLALRSVSEAALQHVGKMAELERLELREADIDGKGLRHMKNLTRLQSLELARSNVVDADLEHLQGLRSLESLDISNTEISDAGLVHLQNLTNLSSLTLRDTNVSDAGLAYLHRLTNLRRLYLEGTRVTDRGLKHLESLQSLEALFLDGTDVTSEGAAKLREALPGCFIETAADEFHLRPSPPLSVQDGEIHGSVGHGQTVPDGCGNIGEPYREQSDAENTSKY